MTPDWRQIFGGGHGGTRLCWRWAALVNGPRSERGRGPRSGGACLCLLMCPLGSGSGLARRWGGFLGMACVPKSGMGGDGWRDGWMDG